MAASPTQTAMIAEASTLASSAVFSFTSAETTQTVYTTEIANFTASLTNFGYLNDTYNITTVKSLPAGWMAGFCLGTMCYWDSALIPLESTATQEISIYIVTGDVPETGTVTFNVTSELDPAQTLSLVFTANTESPPNVPPVASFTCSPTDPEVDEEVAFDASGSSDTDGTIIGYTWDFGDGNTGSGMTVTHTYTTQGNYTATLTVTDNDGATDTTTQTFTDVIPEFSTLIMLISLVTATLVVVMSRKETSKRKQDNPTHC